MLEIFAQLFSNHNSFDFFDFFLRDIFIRIFEFFYISIFKIPVNCHDPFLFINFSCESVFNLMNSCTICSILFISICMVDTPFPFFCSFLLFGRIVKIIAFNPQTDFQINHNYNKHVYGVLYSS